VTREPPGAEREGEAPASGSHSHRLFSYILWGIGTGIAAGLFFGEAIRPLAIVATGFIRLLQVNVLPYLLGSLIASIGSRGAAEMKVMARYGVILLLLVWGLTLLLVVLCPLALPPFSGAPVFGVSDVPATIDWLDLYIPANLFHALTNNLIPAVVLFGILAGIAVGQMADTRKAVLLQALDAFNEAMTRMSRMILTLTPFGLFAIAAVTAGEVRTEDLLRLQVWLQFYAGGTLLLTLWLLPSLVSQLTDVPYRRFLQETRSAIVTAAAAADVLVVLPLIAESAKGLLAERGISSAKADSAVSVAVPLLYNFPHAGKIISLAFLPFAAWFAGSSLSAAQLGLLMSAGPLSLFGNINAAIVFLLDLLQLPADLFSLFSVSSVLNSHLGSMAAAAHTAALSVLVAAAMLGRLRLSFRHLARFVIVTAVLIVSFVAGTRAFFTWVLPPAPSGLETLASFQVRTPLAPSATVPGAVPANRPEPGQRLQEIRARGVLRVGYFDDAVPWAFINARGELTGYDVEAAHRLASQLDVRLEFIHVNRMPPHPSHDLSAGRVDILMSGFTATVARAERMELSNPYASEHVGYLVHDHHRRRFDRLESLDEGEGMLVAIPPVEGSDDIAKQEMPKATIRTYQDVDEVIRDESVTATLMTLERAYYWSRVYPAFTAVRPEEMQAATVLVYAMPHGELDLRSLVNLWIETRRSSGELDEAYEYWIRGRALTPRVPRWSVLNNVLGWR
jgi:Na+/H+-dicarboxylate symporter/ABC-type amino acid transport substrate-binding protein